MLWKAKEILRLSLQMGLSQRDVANGAGCSFGMAGMVLNRVKESNVAYPFSLSMKELGSIIYSPAKEKDKTEPGFQRIDQEMKKKGATLGLLWGEYKTLHPDGYMYTQFCTRYREYRKKNAVYMRKTINAIRPILPICL